MDEQKKLENYLELRIPVKKDPAWKDWSQQIQSLAQDTRTLADGLKAVYDHRPFKPHITLGRVSTEKATLEQLQAALGTIEPPAFSCLLTEAEHRYRSGDCIKTWKL